VPLLKFVFVPVETDCNCKNAIFKFAVPPVVFMAFKVFIKLYVKVFSFITAIETLVTLKLLSKQPVIFILLFVAKLCGLVVITVAILLTAVILLIDNVIFSILFSNNVLYCPLLTI
jgi:hypothetical protein